MEFLNFIIEINTLQAVLLIVGIIFLIIEVFNPGFGAPGIVGLILVVAGIVITANSFMEILILAVIIIIVLLIAIVLAFKSASKGRLSKTLVLQTALNTETGFRSTEDMSSYLGKKGVAITTLRPAGVGEFDGVKLDIVTDGKLIEERATIEIIQVEGRRIIVKEIIE